MVEHFIQRYLSGLSTVTDDLSTYTFETGAAEAPAIFTEETFPQDYTLPAIIISPIPGSVPFGCRDARGAEFLYDIEIYVPRATSRKTLRRLAKSVWLSLDRADLKDLVAEDGWDECGCFADAPVPTDKKGFPGRRIACRIRLMEQVT